MLTRTITVTGLAETQKLLSPEAFRSDMVKLHRLLALKSCGYLKQTCSVDTGRAAAGFMGLFTKYGLDHSRYVAGSQASAYPRMTPPSGAAEGPQPGDSLVIESPLNIVVHNRVNYVEYINSGTSRMAGTAFIDKAMDRTRIYARKLMAWYAGQVRERVPHLLQNPDPGQVPSEIS